MAESLDPRPKFEFELVPEGYEIDYSNSVRWSGRDPETCRCEKCGRFVPKKGEGSWFQEYWSGEWDFNPGRCPKGFGCRKHEEEEDG